MTLLQLLLVALGTVAVRVHAAQVESCGVQIKTGLTVLDKDCIWQQQRGATASALGAVAVSGRQGLDHLPFLFLSNDDADAPAVQPGFSLSLTRFIIGHFQQSQLMHIGVTLPGRPSSTPVLLPLGVYSSAPASLALTDVRLMLSDQDFKTYLEFFRAQLDPTPLTAGYGSINMFTDNRSFVHIPKWSSNTTTLTAVTIVTTACQAGFRYLGGPTLDWKPQLGCNIFIENSFTLLSSLFRYGSIPTPEPMILRIAANISLGVGLKGPIPIRRPVVMVGLSSQTTSVDFGMLVNQLNVTPPYGAIVWNGLVLENIAPGDTLSSLVAPPHSITSTANMWPIFCNRTAELCVRANNVTLVMPDAELNMFLLVFALYHSPIPSLRRSVDYMRTDMKFSEVEFVPGPGNATLTVSRLRSKTWQMRDVVFTANRVVAPKLPVPPRTFVLDQDPVPNAAPLVHAINDCRSLKAAFNYSSSRVFIWRLLTNISISHRGQGVCALPTSNITSQTYLYGQVLPGWAKGGPSAGSIQQAEPTSAATLGWGAAGVAGGGDAASAAHAHAGPTVDDTYRVSFGYAANAFQLPADAKDNFMQLMNVTLAQLPQLPHLPQQPRRGHAGHKRMLLQLHRDDTAGSPAGVWTVLLWPWRRSLNGTPLHVENSNLLLPEPEWALLAAAVQSGSTFAVQLQGRANLIFTDTALLTRHQAIRVGTLQGPGITGSNLWLLQDPAQVAAIPGYSWPAELAAASILSDPVTRKAQEQQDQSGSMHIALGVGLGVGGAVLLACVLLVWWRQRGHAQHLQRQPNKSQKPQQPAADGMAAVAGLGSDSGGGSGGDYGCAATAGSCVRGTATTGSTSRTTGGSLPDALASRDGDTPNSSSRQLAAAAKGTAGAGGGVASGLLPAALGRRLSHLSAGRGGSISSGSEAVAEHSDSVLCSDRGREAVQGGSGSKGPGMDPTGASTTESSVAQGLERWGAAVSATTLLLMRRRLQLNSTAVLQGSSSGEGEAGNCAASTGSNTGRCVVKAGTAAAAGDAALAASTRSGLSKGQDPVQDVELLSLIGTGSFGSVYLGTWRGKLCAVKIMHLPANAMDAAAQHAGAVPDSQGGEQGAGADTSYERGQRRQLWQRQQNSPPTMALMEAVLSSTMCHPNVVSVWTYNLTPIFARNARDAQQQQQQGPDQFTPSAGPAAAAGQHNDDPAAPDQAAADKALVSGWQLKLILEYCDMGTLREALDQKRLPRVLGSSFVKPAVVLSLLHDIASALLHLHSEGVVHGDLKAGNCLLKAGQTNNLSRCGCGQIVNRTAVWAEAGLSPLTGKVADFGLSLPLGPSDTHATMLARGTPTHMAPEIFMEGHISKASDVYAYGILLYEVMTGLRAYLGIPVPLLPHAVAVKGLRPQWPDGILPECQPLQRLAEACWVHDPQDRPSFADIIRALDQCCLHTAAGTTTPGAATATGAAAATGTTGTEPQQHTEAQHAAAGAAPCTAQQPQLQPLLMPQVQRQAQQQQPSLQQQQPQPQPLLVPQVQMQVQQPSLQQQQQLSLQQQLQQQLQLRQQQRWQHVHVHLAHDLHEQQSSSMASDGLLLSRQQLQKQQMPQQPQQQQQQQEHSPQEPPASVGSPGAEAAAVTSGQSSSRNSGRKLTDSDWVEVTYTKTC